MKKNLLVRGALSLLFTAGTLVSGVLLPSGRSALPNDANPDTAGPPGSITINGWEQVRMSSWLDHIYINPGTPNWGDVLDAQDNMSPADTALFDEYMSQYDDVRDASLIEQASAVDVAVNAMMHYERDEKWGTQLIDHWSAPIDTIKSKRGDCEDYALLKYFTLRELGVPADRLYIALVSRDDSTLAVPDHYILLLNVAETGEEFVTLDMRGVKQLIPATEEKPSDGTQTGSPAVSRPRTEGGPYTIFDLRNENGYWQRDWALAPPTGAAALSLAGTLAIMLAPSPLKKKKKERGTGKKDHPAPPEGPA